jgi:uncharacterized protein YPO0396
MEVLNWGTFDEKIYAIRPAGETSLLTGANGSGKTTFVDALLTLIVPEKRYRFYNQSSGSEKKGDRTEDSYVLGGFGAINNELTGTSKTEYLREDKDTAYSILLAHFANEAGQFVTLFQVRHYQNGDMKKYFGIAHKSLTIEEDFKPFDLAGNWKRQLDQRYNKGARKQVEWFDAASRYAQRMVETLGMQSMQALQLFNQTVGIKVLGNLDEFIRQHMLEPRNMEEEFQDLKKQLSTLLDAQRNIEKAEEQIRMLQPLREHYESFQLLETSIEQHKLTLQTALLWKNYIRNALLQTAITENDWQLKALQEQLQTTRTAIEQLNEEELNTNYQIQHNKAGQRLKDLESQIQEREAKQQQAQHALAEFTGWCTQLKLSVTTPADEQSYQQVKKENDRKLHALNNEKRLNDEDDFEARNQKKTATTAREALEQQLNSLQLQRNNIDFHLVQVRKQICEALSLDTSQLPFAGELMAVKQEEMDWQPVLEKLLRPFALRLLVPDKHYKRVTKYINTQHLGVKLVYEHVTETAILQYAEKDTVPDKLQFHPDHPLSKWIEQEIIRLFSYTCLMDEKQLSRYEKALTLNGLVKNGKRHEKDDRPGRNDPGRYVLGWNNEKKKEALLQKRASLVDMITKAGETVARCAGKAKRLDEQFYAHTRIKEHKGFEELHAGAIAKTIQKLQAQAAELRQGNESLNALKNQLSDIQLRKASLEAQREDLLREETRQKDRQDAWRKEAEALQPLLENFTEADKDALLQFQQQHAEKLSAVQLDNLDDIYYRFRQTEDSMREALQDHLNREEKKIALQVSRIKNPGHELTARFPDWPGEVQHLPDDPRYITEYMEWLDKLTKDNLPKYKLDFENFMNVTITHKIAGLKETLDKWERDIDTSVKRLNDSLAGINFNRMPDTYIQLGKRSLPPGTDIREFRQQLLEALPQEANWQQESFEAKSRHFTKKVRPLIDEMDRNENYRNKVLDVRNWFEFWADERYRSTNELKKTYRQMGQLSGGEKAQLTYTILCSAIAYQFGITREGKNSRSLRFIAVDESFSNQDEEKATYLMELCKQLHLQLLVVTPSDKIQIVQDFIAHVHLVQRVNNRTSTLYNMTVKELKEKLGTVPAEVE